MQKSPAIDTYIYIGNTKTRFWHCGNSGNALVLLHGLGGSIEVWWKNVVQLSRHYQVYAVDLAGFGKTDKVHGACRYTLPFFAQFVDKFIQQMGIRTFYLLGLSFGGAVALQYTLNFKEKVKKLVLVDSFALGNDIAKPLKKYTLPLVGEWYSFPSRNTVAQFIRSMMYNPEIVTDEVVDTFCKLSPMHLQSVFLKTIRSLYSFSGLKKKVRDEVVNKLEHIDIPTLIVWGKQDTYVPIEHAYYAQSVIPDASLLFIDKCAHYPPFEQPKLFNDLVISFLKK